MFDMITSHFNYWMMIALMSIGLYAMIAKNNLIKKVIGMAIFQTSVILFFISISVKGPDSTLPILEHGAAAGAIDVAHYANPLPHVLMLTAIVVGVSTLGVALAVIIRVYRRYGTLEEPEILAMINDAD